MPYISKLLKNKVYDSSDRAVGKLEDILISQKNGSFSPLEFLAVKSFPTGVIKYVPYENVGNFTSSDISLKTMAGRSFVDVLPPRQFIYLKRDVLDQQIVDIAGTRVVRVNDLRIGVFDNRMCVLAIDHSLPGLLRRLGFGSNIWPFDFSIKPFKVSLIDWRQAQLLETAGKLQVNTVAEHLGHMHPADMANIVENLDVRQGSSLLAALNETEAAKVLEEVDPGWQNILVKYLGPTKAGKILSHMSTDEIVDLAKTFTTEESQKFLSGLNGGRADKIAKLASYDDNTAGGLMSVEFVGVRPTWTVAQAFEEIRKKTPEFRSILYVYMTDDDGKFLGVASLRRLIEAGVEAKMKSVAKVLTKASLLQPDDKISRIIQIMTRYNLFTAAVIDTDKKLLGIVTIDDVMRQLFPDA